MNYELFLARRIIAGTQYKSTISSSIIKIAISAIALGVIIMLITIATGVGLQKKIKEKIAGFNGHVQITNFEDNNSQITISPVSIRQDFYPEFNTVSGVKNIQVFATKGGIIRTETDFEGVLLKGVGSDYDWSFFKSYLTEGTLPTFSDEVSNDILISSITAKRMKLGINDKCNVFFMKDDPTAAPNARSFKIVGIYNTGFQEFDEFYILGDIRHIQRLNKWEEDEVGGFEVLLDDFDKLTSKGKEIYTAIPSDLNALTIAERFDSIFEWLGLLDTNIIVIIAIMILIAGINMITALLVLILERTQMIGILKALGSANWSIRKIFLYNASYLIAKGLFWGNLIGISILMAQKYFGFIQLNPESYYVSEAPVYLSMGYIVLLNVGVLVLCMLMLLIPSFIVSKISPVKAIKFD
ncbi:ABC transporter permease [Flavobacteriaceae bacterium F08102]|nr:ABC transporter permease [Flavobacteriaceae bacterium F08102]